MEFKGTLPCAQSSQTDWERVKREYKADLPIAYDPKDPDDDPYDPNDEEAVDRFLTEANRVYPSPTAKIRIAKVS
ncbi:MAG TPA: hypothetical protein VL346_10020 [Acidobacteriaceae bacterium]|nr:hypothetical protein [Acidobacteriaceae bacterium]